MPINVIGTIFGTSGYDSHTRQLANALAKYTEVSLTTSLPANWQRDVNDKELQMIKRAPGDINLIITNPINWRMHTDAKRNWAYLVWEGDKIPVSFIKECLNPDIEYIFVPSKHTSDAIYNSLSDFQKSIENVDDSQGQSIMDKVKVIPHGVDLEKFYPKSLNNPNPINNSQQSQDKSSLSPEEDADGLGKPAKPHSGANFVFLANKGLRNLEDRGGIQYLIRAYLDEFKESDNVELILKINPAYGVPNLLKMFPELKKKGPKITMNANNLPYNELINLYNQSDVFVSPTRAESFNIPCLEAMACGKPVITTNFGGQTDFCSDETGWIIGGKLEEVKHEIQYEGIKWLTPDIDELRGCLREAYMNSKCTSKGKKGLEIARKMTWDESAKKIVNFI